MKNLRYEIWEQTCSQTRERINIQTNRSLWFNVQWDKEQIWTQIRHQVWDQIENQLI